MEDDQYSRKRWKFVQHLANVFWNKWKREYMSLLQGRQKWTKAKRNFRVDDIVLVKDADVPRNQWPLGRIIQTFTSSDGLVRSAELITAKSKSTLRRPIQKLVLLLEGTVEGEFNNR